MVGLAAMAVVLGATVLSVDIVHGRDDSREVFALTVPAAPAATNHWDDERGAFAAKLQRGFGLRAADADDFAGWILEASARQNLEPELLATVVMVESSFRRQARSVVGAIGPAQVRPNLWLEVCGGDLHDPEQNVYCGALVLRHYWDLCADHAGEGSRSVEACALAAYNVGFSHRNHVDYVDAVDRYLAKIDRFRAPLRRG